MPILAVDKNGRIYQTSSDREDGQGINGYPEPCEQQDMTLGNAYLNSQARQNDFVMRERLQRKMEDAKDRAWANEMRKRYASKLRRELAEQAIMESNEKFHENQLRRALQMGCCPEYNQGITGNALSSNGMKGFQGWDRNQRAIHHALNPDKFPSNTAFGVDPMEKAQAEERARAYKILQKRSRGISE